MPTKKTWKSLLRTAIRKFNTGERKWTRRTLGRDTGEVCMVGSMLAEVGVDPHHYQRQNGFPPRAIATLLGCDSSMVSRLAEINDSSSDARVASFRALNLLGQVDAYHNA